MMATIRSSEARIATDLFRHLEQSGIRYCVLGNSSAFPDRVDGDIDFVVESGALRTIPDALIEFCNRHGARIAQCLRHEISAFYFVLAWFEGDGTSHFLKVDFCADFRRKGRLLLTAEELLRDRTRAMSPTGHDLGFFVPPARVALLYYLLKRIDKLSIETVHTNYLQQQWRIDPGGALEGLKRFWNSRDASVLAGGLDGGDWTIIRRDIRHFQKSLRTNAPRRAGRPFRETYRRIGRFCRPTGFCVAVLGADGSGKSTLISSALDELEPLFRHTTSLHLRPSIGLRRAGEPTVDPHGAPPRGATASLVKAAYYLLDTCIGHITLIRPKLVRSTLVIYDRYIYDLSADPARYRFAGPDFGARMLNRLAPRPDLVVVLDVPAEIAQHRKQEIPFEESVRVRLAYLDLARSLPRAVVVDAASTPAEVLASFSRAVVDAMASRQAKLQRLNVGSA